MKAVSISRNGGPEVLELVDLPDPEPGEGEVLVRIHAIGVAKPDYLMRSGKYRWAPPLPAVIGNEASGHIEAIGPAVTDLTVGQPVLVWGYEQGCYAELGAFPRHRIEPLPATVDLDIAVNIPNYMVAWAMLHEVAGGPAPGTVYVNGGAGGIGTAVIQTGRAAGIQVIAGTSSADKCAFALSCGAVAAIDYSREAPVRRLLEITDGRGVNLFLDQLGGPDFSANLEALAIFGTIVSFNALNGLPDADLFAAMRNRLGRCPAVRCFSWHGYDRDPEGRARVMKAVIDLFARGAVSPPVHARLALADARHAHEMLDAREIRGKVILKP